MQSNVFKSSTSKQIGMKIQICRILDNEYHLIVKEIDCRMGTLSQITQTEICTKLKNLSLPISQNSNYILEDRQTRNQRARCLIEMVRRFSRQDNYQSKQQRDGSHHNLPYHIISKTAIKFGLPTTKPTTLKSEVMLGLQNYKINNSVKRSSSNSQQRSSLQYYSETRKENCETLPSSIRRTIKTKTYTESDEDKPIRQISLDKTIVKDNKYHSTQKTFFCKPDLDSKFQRQSSKIKINLDLMMDQQQNFSEFIGMIKK